MKSGYSYEEWQNLQHSIHNTFGNNEQQTEIISDTWKKDCPYV
jgi:hypothetical protein